VTILGDAGSLLDDFDFDPEVMVPAMKPFDAAGNKTPGYAPQFDAALSRDKRAQAAHKTVVFTLAPNSILSMNATEGKLMRLQLARMGMYDVWSLMESLEIPNFGKPPAIPLPPIVPPDPAELARIAQQPGGVQALAAKYTLDPASGQLLEIREPMTVTERLIAQAQLGIGMAENAPGRKATGQAPPKMEQKGDGRTTVTESPHKPGPHGND